MLLAARAIPPADGQGACWQIPCVVWLLAVIVLIVIYGYTIRALGAPDVLEGKIIDDPAVHNFDGWAGTHLLFWAFLGVWYPGHYVSALGLSLGWEAIEDCLGRGDIKVSGRRLQLIGETGNDSGEGYWYGRYVTDSFFNLAGYILGSAAANVYWPDRTCEELRAEASLGAAPGPRAAASPEPAQRS